MTWPNVWTVDSIGNSLLNLGLVAGGVVLALLIYAFGSHLAAPDVSPIREKNPANLLGEVIQVEVRNGCGVPNAAAQVTSYLRDRGFDVVAQGNYEHFNQDSTLVIDRVGNLQAARKVARILGLSPDRVSQRIDTTRYLDASVIIGEDYPTMRPFEN